MITIGSQSNGDRDSNILRDYSCLICRQRKIRCDRQDPCSNCLKAESQCSFVAPVRGKRKKKSKPVLEGLHAKLRRYERMLENHGVDLDQPIEHGSPDSDATPDSVIQTPESSSSLGTRQQTRALDAVPSHRCSNNPSSKHIDGTLWSNIGGDIDNCAPDEPLESVDSTDENDDSLFKWLEGRPSSNQCSLNLGEFYPDPATFSQFQHVYAEQIDPMMKVLHLPSLFSTISAALASRDRVPKNTEAVLLCFCLATVSTMSQDQCRAILKHNRVSVMRSYKKAAMQALTNTRFLESPDLINLQALSLYLLGAKSLYSCGTFHILCGCAVRLSMRIGLHRDGTTLGLPPFETELRRRLWWHIIQFDFRISEFLTLRPSMDIFIGDTKPPLNLEDEDISPGMTKAPVERKGITSLALFRVRCDITQFLSPLYLSSLSSQASGFKVISSDEVSMEEKARMIAELEDKFESKYLRYCDPSEPLHTFAAIVIRSVICRMRVLTYSPRYFAQKQMKLPESEREIVFVNASKLLEYAVLIRSNPDFHKYMWRTSATYIWDTILQVLIAARHRKAGPEIEQLWHLIGVLISHHPDTFGRAAEAVRAALSKWIPEVWDEYAAAATSQGLPIPVRPDYIAEMRASSDTATTGLDHQDIAVQHSTDMTTLSMEMQHGDMFPTDDCFEFLDLDAFATDPNEWHKWERLLAGDDMFSDCLT